MSLQAPIFYHFLESIDSTNSWVRLHYQSFDLSQMHIVHAAEQTKGRGTHGKSWTSPKDLNLYATIFFKTERVDATIAQVLSMSIISVLKSKGLSPAIKWPNDIMLNHKKIGGILCELVPLDGKVLVLLGVGLNINMPEVLCQEIDQPASSLFASSGRLFAITPILHLIGEQFRKDFAMYQKEGFSPFCDQYNILMPYQGYPVMLHGKQLGTSEHVNRRGELEILSPEGTLTSITSGSIHLC